MVTHKMSSSCLAQKFVENEKPEEDISSWETSSFSGDINALFTSLNKRFFWGRLDKVEVFWSNRMTSCAGLCYYKVKQKYCYIRLSAPLLKLRPHSDLINTLLHEMIHAYLFVTEAENSREGHGPEFHHHKDRINKEAGTNITVYHTFHAEVRLYKQHWWRCGGQCQSRAPYFGMVKRSMNRAPGPSDRWWKRHLATCEGTFTKIREPVEFTKKMNNGAGKLDKANGKNYAPVVENIVGLIDLTNENVGPSSTSTASKRRGGMIGEFVDLTGEPELKRAKPDSDVCCCPVCNASVARESVGEHLETCAALQDIFDVEVFDDDDDNDELNNTAQSCPICSSDVEGDLKYHVDDCLNNSGIVNIFDEPFSIEDQSSEKVCDVNKKHKFSVDRDAKVPEIFSLSDNDSLNNSATDKGKLCPICNKTVETNLEEHCNECLNNSFSFDDFDDPIVETGYSPVPLNVLEKQVKRNKKRNTAHRRKTNIHGDAENNKRGSACRQIINGDMNTHLDSCATINIDTAKTSSGALTCEVANKTNFKEKVNDWLDNLNDCYIVGVNDSPEKQYEWGKKTETDKRRPLNDVEYQVIEISDSESSIKITNNFKVPFPKPLVMNSNAESERRVACRVCGMRFGVSKFADHVCYET